MRPLDSCTDRRVTARRRVLAIALMLAMALHGCATHLDVVADSDAPAPRRAARPDVAQPASYAEAVRTWRSPEDLNGWIGERFEYDEARAMRLSESQREARGTLPIHAPAQFYARPAGVCVDLARFAVETLQVVAPEAKARYVMLEFAPVTIRGNLLRRHWVVAFERDGLLYFFADSKRPGTIAGPYASTQAFIEDYARFRHRPITAFRELPSYQRRVKVQAVKAQRDDA